MVEFEIENQANQLMKGMVLSIEVQKSQQSMKLIHCLFYEALDTLTGESFLLLGSQFKILLKSKLNTNKKITVLKDRLHRKMIIELANLRGIQFYNYSYFNRAKITQRHIEYLKQIGPYLFVEAIMLVSKLNVINKNYSRILTQNHLYCYAGENGQEAYKCEYTIIDIKINQILKLCDEKKRNMNNNLKKLDLLLEDIDIRVQLIKELGKILRDSWKKDKSNKANDMLVVKSISRKESQKKQEINEKQDINKKDNQEEEFVSLNQENSEMKAEQRENQEQSLLNYINQPDIRSIDLSLNSLQQLSDLQSNNANSLALVKSSSRSVNLDLMWSDQFEKYPDFL